MMKSRVTLYLILLYTQVDSGNMARYRQYENPFAFAVSTTINDRNPCKECSSTMNRNSST